MARNIELLERNKYTGSIKGEEEYNRTLMPLVTSKRAYDTIFISVEEETPRPMFKLGRSKALKSIKVTGGEVCLFTISGASILAGIVTGIWPIALAGIGPLLLALFDILDRRSHRKATSRA